MPNQSNRRIITNRQLNFTLCPVDTYNKKEMPYSLSNYAIDGTWNHHHSIMLDVILNQIFNHLYSSFGRIPRSWTEANVVKLTSNFLNGAITPENLSYMSGSSIDAYCEDKNEDIIGNLKSIYVENSGSDDIDDRAFARYVNAHFETDPGYQYFKQQMDAKVVIFNDDILFRLNIMKLYKNYPFLIKYQQSDLSKHIQKIGETSFQMNHKVKYMTILPVRNEKGNWSKKGKQIDIYYNMKGFEPIFLVDIGKEHITVNFKSPLGKLILQNTLMLDTDWPPEEALELSKNAYFIYKRFVLNSAVAKKKKEMIRLWFDDIKSFLDLRSQDNTYIHKKIIVRALEEMQQRGLIFGYNWNKHYKQKQYLVFLTVLSDDVKKGQSKTDNLLKV
jgi:hypothetical protein